ncbi:hypothetical protein FQA39_LY00200 [Lamprigera yunnana]|nr:hypothetical protein FQA39_LY00200 [Lamprigera yunnana]
MSGNVDNVKPKKRKRWDIKAMELAVNAVKSKDMGQVVVGTHGIQLLKQPKSKVLQSSEVLEEIDLLTADNEAIQTQATAEIADISHTPNNDFFLN